MSGHGKSFVWQDYLTAYETMWHGLIELDEPVAKQSRSIFGEDVNILRVDRMESNTKSPEEITIKKDAYMHLSNEAKEIISLILNAPQDILELFLAPKYNKISRHKVKEHLISKGWAKEEVKSCFLELKKFTSDLY